MPRDQTRDQTRDHRAPAQVTVTPHGEADSVLTPTMRTLDFAAPDYDYDGDPARHYAAGDQDYLEGEWQYPGPGQFPGPGQYKRDAKYREFFEHKKPPAGGGRGSGRGSGSPAPQLGHFAGFTDNLLLAAVGQLQPNTRSNYGQLLTAQL